MNASALSFGELIKRNVDNYNSLRAQRPKFGVLALEVVDQSAPLDLFPKSGRPSGCKPGDLLFQAIGTLLAYKLLVLGYPVIEKDDIVVFANGTDALLRDIPPSTVQRYPNPLVVTEI